jgi:nucleotide-binding universal stress UspA family protein
MVTACVDALGGLDVLVNNAGIAGPTVPVGRMDPDEYANEKDIDLVAFGIHGRSVLFDALIGSMAQSLVSTLPCDALVVGEPEPRRPEPDSVR